MTSKFSRMSNDGKARIAPEFWYAPFMLYHLPYLSLCSTFFTFLPPSDLTSKQTGFLICPIMNRVNLNKQLLKMREKTVCKSHERLISTRGTALRLEIRFTISRLIFSMPWYRYRNHIHSVRLRTGAIRRTQQLTY